MIVFFTYKASSAGANKMTFLLAEYFKRLGLKVMVICSEGGPLVDQYSSKIDIEIINKNQTFLNDSLSKRIENKIRFYKNYYKSNDLIKKIKPNIAYISSSIDYGFNKSILNNHVKLILHAQGIYTSLINTKFKNGKYFFLSDHIISISEEVKRNLIFNFGINSDKITTIPNGIDLEEIQSVINSPRFNRNSFGLHEDDIVILSAGTLSWRKGADIFVDAAIQVLKKTRNEKIKFLWVGAKSNNDSLPNVELGLQRILEEKVKNENLEQNILFIPAVNKPYDIYNISDIYVISSREEAFGLVITENMYLEKPIIAFPIGGIPEVLQYGGGVFTSHISSNSLADSIIINLLLENWKSISNKSKDIVLRNYNINKQIKNIYDVFAKLSPEML